MQALVFHGPNNLSLEQIPVPAVGVGEVLIRVHTATICGTDLRIVSGKKTRDVRLGHPIGHECAGTIAAVGEGVEGYGMGDRVAICVVVTCGACDYCDNDQENLCRERITLGYHTDGAFAEYMLIPAHAVRRGNVYHLPDSVPIESASLIEPMACCINGQHEMGLSDEWVHRKARRVVIFGAGPIGLFHLMLIKARWPGVHVTVVEPSDVRRRHAIDRYADVAAALDAQFEDDSFDAAILAVGVADLVPRLFRLVQPGGRVNLFAGFDVGASSAIDPNEIHYKQLHVTGASESRRRDYTEALMLVGQGRIEPAPLITHRFALADHAAAFDTAAAGKGLKVAFQIGPPAGGAG